MAAPSQPEYPANDVLDRLMLEVATRARELPPNSYTTKLIQGGVAKMGAKIIEEAAEVVDAAEKMAATISAAEAERVGGALSHAAANHQHLIYEACDLIYHLWVLLGSHGISVEDLRQELQRREGMSGREEKRRRSNTKNCD
jgi:phosphoribosyl-ATP pyrophosphohydrolase